MVMGLEIVVVVTWSACVLAAETQTRIIECQNNNDDNTEGILEVFGDGLLYYFEENWKGNYRNAIVACKEMGFKSVASFMKTGPNCYSFHGSNHTVYIINCTGEEQALSQCKKRNGNLEVNIEMSMKMSCAEFIHVRLVGGHHQNEGQVQVFVNNTWGTVCDDDWNQPEANVVCKQLGYNSSLASIHYYPTASTSDILLDNTQCLGNESDILLCHSSQLGITNCNSDENVGIICEPTECGKTPTIQHATCNLYNIKEAQCTCDQGYKQHGGSTIVCQENGEWSMPIITCKLYDDDPKGNSNAKESMENSDNSGFMTAVAVAITALIISGIAIMLGILFGLLIKNKYRCKKRKAMSDTSTFTPLIPLNVDVGNHNN